MAPFYSVQEAADYLQVDYKVVYRLVKEGKLPSSRVGWQFRITQEDLNAYLNAERAKQESLAHSLRNQQPAGASIPSAARSQEAAPVVNPPFDAPTAGAPPTNTVTKIRARQVEQNYINRFQEKVETVETIRHPATGQLLPVRNWRETLVIEEDRAALMQALNSAFLDRKTLATTPRNVRCRYTLEVEPPFVLEARVLAHLEAFCRTGFDDQPATLEDLMVAIDEYEEELRKRKLTIVAGLASPTGWEPEAIAYVTNTGRGDSYRNRNIMLIVVDLRNEAVYYDENDAVARGFAGLYELATDTENVTMLRAHLLAELDGRSGLILADTAQALGVAVELLEEAAKQLVSEGGYRLVPDKSDGLIMVKV
jgi:excisionase family DNA binding protein